MAISKKGSRSIVVDGTEYLYKVSKVKKKAGWREQSNELNDVFMKYASYYGLGKVKDITINIIIQLKEKPVSSCFIKIHSVLVDGFMGAEQITTIKPGFVAELINEAIKDGWIPSRKEDFRMSMAETNTKEREPVILQIPNMNEGIADYQNIDKPNKVDVNH